MSRFPFLKAYNYVYLLYIIKYFCIFSIWTQQKKRKIEVEIKLIFPFHDHSFLFDVVEIFFKLNLIF